MTMYVFCVLLDKYLAYSDSCIFYERSFSSYPVVTTTLGVVALLFGLRMLRGRAWQLSFSAFFDYNIKYYYRLMGIIWKLI